jgi:uncharacterized protein
MRSAVLAFCLLAVAASSAWAQAGRTYDDRPKISVSGEATINVTPDKITVQFGVETQDKNMLAAKQKSNDIVKKAFAAIKACGVKDRDVQTQYLYAEPRWTPQTPSSPYAPSQGAAYPPAATAVPFDANVSRQFLGYFVRNTIAVTVTDTAKIDKLISDVLAAGATDIYGIDFQTSELKAHREKAREMALKAAKEKAEKMAAVLGQKIGEPIDISEFGATPSYGYNANAQTVASSVSAPSEAISAIALGKIAVMASVNVVFELKR